jgi:prevent-host-death family protein
MKKVGIADLKAHLSGHLRDVKQGEVLLVMERSTPIARVVPAGQASGVVIRPPLRPLSEAKKRLRALPRLELAVSSLDLLLEDRRR